MGQIAITSPRIMGYRLFFETFSYTRSNKLLDKESHESETELWFLGHFHIVISKET